MKLKRLFAGILAVAMMATMAAPAFADGTSTTTTYTYPTATSKDTSKILETNGHAYLPITKTVKVLKGVAPDSMTFDFELMKDNDTSTSYSEETVTPEVPTNQTTLHVTVGNNEGQHVETNISNATDLVAGMTVSNTFNIDLAALDLTHVGKYTYILKETAGSIPGITYDTSTLKLVVSVVNANETNPDGRTFVYYAALYRDSVAEGNKISATEAFTNYYGKTNDNTPDPDSPNPGTDPQDTVHSITLSKDVKGDFADITKIFKFTVKLLAADGKTSTDYKGATVTYSDNYDTTDKLENYLIINGTSETTYTVWLKRGENITIGNLPDGVNVEITEVSNTLNNNNAKDVDLTDYSTTIKSKETSEVGATVTTQIFTKDSDMNRKYSSGAFTQGNNHDKTVDYTNTRDGVPDTGVILDNAPYIALLLIAAAGAVVMVVKKRRREE